MTSTLAVPGSFTITDVNVIIGSLAHTWDSDLELKLISPGAAVTVTLASWRGGTGDNWSPDISSTDVVPEPGASLPAGLGLAAAALLRKMRG